MSEQMMVGFAFVAGLILGALYFLGLWWTVRKGLSSPRAAVWFTGSLLLRVSAALLGFYFVSSGQWQRLVACLFGFVLARVVVTRLLALPRQTRPPVEVTHAP